MAHLSHLVLTKAMNLVVTATTQTQVQWSKSEQPRIDQIKYPYRDINKNAVHVITHTA